MWLFLSVLLLYIGPCRGLPETLNPKPEGHPRMLLYWFLQEYVWRAAWQKWSDHMWADSMVDFIGPFRGMFAAAACCTSASGGRCGRRV